MSEVLAIILALCGPGHRDLARPVLAASNRWNLPPALLISVMKVESSCNPAAIGPKGSLGLMQIMPGGSAARGTPPAMLLLPAVSLRLGGRHLAHWLRRCGDIQAALGVFAGYRDCAQGRASGYAGRVMRLFEQAKGEPRS